ncbi:MAG: CRISPR-associated helicase Cas3' [Butyrivibrio sp.]|nr:CRISPR-associated helicase Cas3' [Butyrivibrio sp.]
MIAHINELGEEQSIKEHLEGTARFARGFAEAFDCGDMGYFCGILHDIGKYSDEFQRRITAPDHTQRVDHSTAGALVAMQRRNTPAAMAIAGHHSGLLDGGSPKVSEAGDGTFFGRLKKTIPSFDGWKNEITPNEARMPSFCKDNGFSLSFFTRMLYSCLVDADYLDTERFMNGNSAERGKYASVGELCDFFDKYTEKWLSRTEFESEAQRLLCGSRNRILKECMRKGESFARGLYSLTVPTGGGKTTASLGFALKHMRANGMNRVIYVIPYTSVIDQNAEVFKAILGSENVLEHHSGVLFEADEGSGEKPADYRKALAAENWDMPVTVTTAVQFFESLFANKSSKCRKLHNLANSVIILDEAQTLPVPYLEPCVAAISELVKNYKATAVLCTATQPALENIFANYLPDIKINEICGGTDELFAQFRRSTIKDMGAVGTEELWARISDRKQVLCIVNKRKTAQELYSAVPTEGAYCLTTLLCPFDRKRKLEEIKERLKDGKPCRVIATSLIEAGVDLDFPEVYRQETGLDSLIQAAGRCNREGRRSLNESNVYMFRIEGDDASFVKQNIDALRETLRKYSDPTALEAVSHYFVFYRKLLGSENLDQKDIMKAFNKGIDGKLLPFATAAEAFKLIENQTRTVYIPRAESNRYIESISGGRSERDTFRKLGQFGVNVYPEHFNKLWAAGCLEMIDDYVCVLRDMNQYREDTGLQLDVDTGFGLYI